MKIISYLVATTILMTGSSLQAFASQPAKYSRVVETRAVWMDRRSIPKTEQAIRALIRSYSEAGINIIFPEVIYNGYSTYPSKYLTQQDLWDGLDMLSILIDEAHKQKIEVHPWVWVFRAGYAEDIGGILSKHPDWAAVSKDGDVLSPGDSYWLCPGVPEARALLINAYTELAEKYPIDGLHLDYIRFESQSKADYGYNQLNRERFKTRYGVDPMDVEPFTPLFLDWHLWRENLIDTFIAETSAAVKKVRPHIQVSAAVGAVPDQSRLEFFQNWAHWADNRWIDFLSPMIYTNDTDTFRRNISIDAARIQGHALLVPGLGLHLTDSIQPILDEIRIIRETSVSGIGLFSTAYLQPDELCAFAQGVFEKKAAIPVADPLLGARLLISSASGHLNQPISEEQISGARTDLKSAGTLLDYASYRITHDSYIPPEAPPIFIPMEVKPVPSAVVPLAVSAPLLDGKLDDIVWKSAAVVTINTDNLGSDILLPTDVFLACDKENLYVAFRAHTSSTPRAEFMERDAPVFQDDSVEVFVGTAKQPYYQFAVNVSGTKYDAKVTNPNWNGEWKSAVGIDTDAWNSEFSIPHATINLSFIPEGIEWRANFCRNRVLLNNEIENSCWSPTYGTYHTPIRFGVLTPSLNLGEECE